MNKLTVQEAKEFSIGVSTAQNPVLFPVADIAIANEQGRSEFLADHLGSRAAVAFKHCLYEIAGMLNEEYKGGYWEFAEMDDGKVFFCYPADDKLFTCANRLNYAEGVMDNKTFGFICSFIALGRAFYHINQSDAVLLSQKYHNARLWALEKLYNQVYDSQDADLIISYRKFSREFYKFTD
ncbi:hypothetical protein MOVS_10680 (plasmid) [Moraxella ovis]|uniref:Antirestriction protein n=1 Tax=Moraxella ovis TaxID=29433 RepID=A0A378QCC6_9GAMM|nr:antirestriction protein [Moraxella ovis]ANB92554.1 hypothetical protein MOVS_10680 [Moraxella ovis]STY98557.1 Antirestriction protein [Moraxella ovis]STY98604.1 Antirestriction protein [Moraxella ovis]